MRRKPFRVDLATQDPRPLNPITEESKRINIYNPSSGITSPEPLVDIYRFIPARVVHFRVFALTHTHDEALARAAEKALDSLSWPIQNEHLTGECPSRGQGTGFRVQGG